MTSRRRSGDLVTSSSARLRAAFTCSQLSGSIRTSHFEFVAGPVQGLFGAVTGLAQRGDHDGEYCRTRRNRHRSGGLTRCRRSDEEVGEYDNGQRDGENARSTTTEPDRYATAITKRKPSRSKAWSTRATPSAMTTARTP